MYMYNVHANQPSKDTVCKFHLQVLTKEEFVHLPPGEVDSQQDADLDNDYVKE